MAATVSLEQGERDKNALKSIIDTLEPLDNVFLHEKTQKLFKYARARDKHEALKNEVLDIKCKEQRRDLCRKEDERQNTALHYAAKAGNLDTCQFLVEQGADIKALGQNKMTPLQFAARYGDEKKGEEVWMCMKWIMEEEDKKKSEGSSQKEKEIFFDGRDDFSILQHAIQNTNWEEDPVVVWELIKTRKFNISDPDKQGNTSLHLAAEFTKQERLLDVFLDDKNIPSRDLKECIQTRNMQGKTPLHIACRVGNPDSVMQLLEATKDLEIKVPSIIDSPDNDGQHPLHLAIESGNLEMMKILMEEGVAASKEAIKCAVRFVHKILFKFLFTFFLQDRQYGRL